jgi:hypothetical protein
MNMFEETRCISSLFPARMELGSRDIDRLIDDLRREYPAIQALVTAGLVRDLALGASERLTAMGLPHSRHGGAVSIHVLQTNDPIHVVQQGVSLHLKLMSDGWCLERASVGLVFPHEPLLQGLRLQWSQHAYLLRGWALRLQASRGIAPS